MSENILHAALLALFLALVCATGVSYRGSVLAAERMAAHRTDACRAILTTEDRTTRETAHSSCS